MQVPPFTVPPPPRITELLTLPSDRMKTMMPNYLGVSKAILESVIFCHQEESLWPLSEPSKLKGRFDEIFEALKYTKAITNIRDMQKARREQLKILVKDEEVAKLNKDRAEKIRKQCSHLQDELTKLEEESKQKGQEIKQATESAEDAWHRAETFGATVAELQGKRIAQQTKQEGLQSLRQTLKEMSDSDEELQRMLEQYEERVHAYNEDLTKQKSHYYSVVEDIKRARGHLSSKERDSGSHEAQQDNHERQVQSRSLLVKGTARRHGIRGFDADLDETQIGDFVNRIAQMARDQQHTFERARKETQEELQRTQAVLNQINERKSACNQRKENARQTMTLNDGKITNLQASLNKINVDEGNKAALEISLRESIAKYEGAQAEIQSSNSDEFIAGMEKEVRSLEDCKEKLDEELSDATRRAGDSARIDYVQDELMGSQQALNSMVGAHSEKIRSVIGGDWRPENLDDKFRAVLDEHTSQLSEAESQRDVANRELERLDYKLSSCQSDLKAKQDTCRAAENAISEAVDCEPSEYLEEVKKIEGSRDVLKSDADSFFRALEYFERCIKEAEQHNRCRTCARAFGNEKQRDTMFAVVQKEKAAFPERSAVTKDLAEYETELQAARGVSSEFEVWERLQHKEIPALQRDEKALAIQRDELVRQLEQRDVVVNDHKSSKRDAEALSRIVQRIAKYVGDIVGLESQIEELQTKQKSLGLSRGLEAIQNEQKKIGEELRATRSRLNAATGDRERRNTIMNKLELEISNTKSQVNTAEYQLKERNSLQSQVDEYKKLNSERREELRSIERELQELVPNLSQTQLKYDDIAQRGAEKDRELQAEANGLNSSLSQLQTANQNIKAYLEKGGPDQLNRVRREVEYAKEELGRLETQQSDVVREVKKLEDELRNHSDTKRSISDNQRFRRDVSQLEILREEIEALEGSNAEAERANLERQGRKWQQERNKIAAEQATISGAMRSKHEQLQSLLSDTETEYKDAAKVYREAHVKVETTKACVDDLARYGGALDKAIMKFHSIKMEEINKIIADLWRETYQGTDVDRILIKSESEVARGNKTHNYRVCMVKQDAEMDMRGRCSAGQKVLACIIIRLALAECFGVHCGLIALDEPTTNLDRDNIRALAESLSKIIKMRRSQPNFQLIVITHDEEFLKYMGCSDYTDFYYRVSRNERQKSTIERQSIAEVSCETRLSGAPTDYRYR